MTYPVTGTMSGVLDGLNYVLSGPGGLGQNFAGFSNYELAYLTGNFRTPFTVLTYNRSADGLSGAFTITVEDTRSLAVGMTASGLGIGVGATVSTINGTTVTLTVANSADVENTVTFGPAVIPKLYVAPISINNAQQIDARTIKYTFTTAQPSPPFQLGNGLTVTGITPSTYNSSSLRNAGNSINPIGVIECTTTYVVVRTVSNITTALGSYVSGGTVEYSSMNAYNSTDCDVRATILGRQERVFIAAQMNQLISYTATTSSDINIYVEINRYKAFVNNDPTNPDFVFDDRTTISSKKYAYTGVTGSGTYPLETIFTSVIDNPGDGYYRYILEVYFEVTNNGDIEVTQDILDLRSLTGQVVKP
jgi:hypothetical protein